jgi:CheY-like chemotaxis protein
MKIKVTIIEDSRESQIKFLQSIDPKVPVEMQLISAPPFFDEKVEKSIAEFGPDLIILDLLLLEEIDSGFRVLRQLKDSESLNTIPVVVCSKFIGPDPKDKNRLKALGFGAAAGLSKTPFPESQDFLRYAKSEKE